MRRIALLGAVAVVLVLLVSYGVRRWRAHQARQQVPAAIPGDVQQQAEKFTFSRSEGGQVLFTVEASRTIERAGKTTVLEDVVAVIHGRRGDRADEIRTPRCEYDAGGTGAIYCPGEVTMKLGGSTDADTPGPDQFIHLVTRKMNFDPARGVAWTEEAVAFEFTAGSGRGVGLRYQPGEPAVQLESQVRIRLARGGDAPVQIEGAQLHYYTRQQYLELLPPLSIQHRDRRLRAARLRLHMDETYRAQRLEAAGDVRLRVEQEGGPIRLQAPRLGVSYGPGGQVERVSATGSVEIIRQGEDRHETLTAQETVFRFGGAPRELENVTARGQAELVVRSGEVRRELRAPEMNLSLAGPNDRQVLTARGRGSLVMRLPGGDVRTLEADIIELTFEQKDWLRALAALGDVQTELRRPGGGAQTTESAELSARFDRRGEVLEAEQWGGFRYRSEDSRAEAGRARYDGVAEVFHLTEQPAVWDAGTRTTARVITLAEKPGTLEAEGDVRTTRQPGAGAGGFGAGALVHLAADHLRAERARGWARYEGHARLWDKDSRLAADAIEIFREPRRLTAHGNVRSLFLEAAPDSGDGTQGEPRAVAITSHQFTYVEADRRGLFEGDVVAENEFGRLGAPRVEIYLASGNTRGAQRVERAHAEGGVRIKQPGRQATSQQADYHAGQETVVLSGGSPTIRDARGSTVTGAQLTLFLTDGTIRVDSDETERTLTRRPRTAPK